MFSLEQIQEAHSKVQSGADFPAYIQDIKKLGVTCYETVVSDGHTNYYGSNGYLVTSAVKHETLTIAGRCDSEQFKAELRSHQQGKTSYPAFIKTCASTGVERWKVCLEKMNCIYYDKTGNEILVEEIPQ